MHDNRETLNKTNWSKISKLLIKLRLQLINVKEKYELDIFIPSILNTPLEIDTGKKQKSIEIDSLEDEDSESESETEIKERDLNGLTIPALITLSGQDNELGEKEEIVSNTSIEESTENIMTDISAQTTFRMPFHNSTNKEYIFKDS